jgi:hypothetical protein
LQKEISQLKEEMQTKFKIQEENQARFKVLEDEVNLLGRFISELNEDRPRLSEKNQEILTKIQSILDSNRQRMNPH